MKKKRIKYFFGVLVILLSALLLSCSKPTIEDDAQRAAELTGQSNQYSMENNYRDAGRTYEEVQEIMDKYKKLDKFDEFYMLYTSFLQEASYSLDDETGGSNASPE